VGEDAIGPLEKRSHVTGDPAVSDSGRLVVRPGFEERIQEVSDGRLDR
jgi:hypothetical protein